MFQGSLEQRQPDVICTGIYQDFVFPQKAFETLILPGSRYQALRFQNSLLDELVVFGDMRKTSHMDKTARTCHKSNRLG